MIAWLARLIGHELPPPRQVQDALDTAQLAEDAISEARRASQAYWLNKRDRAMLDAYNAEYERLKGKP